MPVILDIYAENTSFKNEGGAATLESSLAVPQKKLKIELSIDLAITLLGIYPIEMGKCSHKNL